MNFFSGIGHWFGNLFHPQPQAPAPRPQIPARMQLPPQQQAPAPHPSYNLGNFLAQHLGQVAGSVAHTVAQIPNIHLQGLEQLTHKPVTVGSVAKAAPVLGPAIKFAQLPQQQQTVPTFIKGITGAGIQGAGYVAPELRVFKPGEAAPLVAKVASKFVNQAVPAAGFSVAGDLVGGNRNPGQIAQHALFNAGAAGVANAAPTLVKPLVAGGKLAVKAAPSILSSEAGHIAPGQSVTNPKIVPNQFTEHVKTSPEVSSETQGMVSGQHAQRSTQALIDNANSALNKKGGLAKLTNQTLSDLSVPSGDATDQQLVNAIQAAKAHDALGTQAGHDMATSLYDQVAEHGVGSGQRSQALSVLASRTPEGQRYVAQKIFKSAGVKVTPELQSSLDAAITRLKGATEGTQEHYAAQQQLANTVNNALPSKNIDKVFRLFRAGLLTGPQTVSKVLLSHGVMNGMEGASNVAATGIDRTIAAMGGQRSTALTGRGTVSGAVTGLKAAGHLLKTGEDTVNTGGFTGFNTKLGQPQANFQSKALSWLNPYMAKVEQTHAALPKAFYTSAHDNSLNRQAIAAWKNAGSQGSKDEFVKNFVANPTAEAAAEAKHAGEMAAFQQQTKLGKSANQLQKVPGGRWLTPFAHIASSILTDAVNYSPVGAAKTVYEAVRDKGSAGWTPTVQKHFVEGLGRSIVGTGIVATGAALYKAGVMTLGYPADPKERALWQANGKQENSILLNGKWRQLSSLGPQAITLAMGGYAASAGDVGGKGNAVVGALAGALKTLSGQSYLSGLTEASKAITDPQQGAAAFIKNEAGALVPNGIGTLARAIDPSQRTVNSPLDAIKARIPGLRETLPVKLNTLGSPVPRQGGVATNLLDPTKPQPAVGGPVLNELNRLDAAHNPVMPVPVKTIGSGADAVKLTQAQQDARNAQAGPAIQAAYQQVMGSPGYAQLSDANKAKALSNAESDVNAVANARTLQQIAPDKFQKAYSGLSVDQKVMFAGVNSPKDYTALTSAGTSVAGSSGATPAQKYQSALATYQAQKAAGLLSPEQDFKTQQTLGKQAITSKYSQDVNDLYGMSKVERNAFIAANPKEAARLMPQVNALDQELAAQGWIAKAKLSTGGGGSASSKKYAALSAKIAHPTPKFKTISVKKFSIKRARIKA